MQQPASVTTFLFTDIEGSTRLWERQPERMRAGARPARRAGARSRREHARAGRQDDRRRHSRRVRRSARRRARGTAAAAGAGRSRRDGRRVRSRVRCGLHAGDRRAPRQRLLRQRRQPRRAHHERRARRPDARVADGRADLVGDRASGATSRCATSGSCGCAISRSPERVYQVVHPTLRQDFPPLRSLEATPNNLPQQVTSFVGRERELDRGRARCSRDRASSRSSAPAASARRGCRCRSRPSVIDDYPGRRLVRRARRHRRSAARAAGRGVGARRHGGRRGSRSSRRCSRTSRERQLLLMLDNCEHLVERVRGARDSSCCRRARAEDPRDEPRAAEHRRRDDVRAAGAGVPGDGARRVTSTALLQSEAARLFVERATAVQPAVLRRRQPTRRRRRRSAAGWTASRSRSSSPRRACARCRSKRSPSASTTLPAADRRRSHGAAAAADAARADRLEPRAAD